MPSEDLRSAIESAFNSVENDEAEETTSTEASETSDAGAPPAPPPEAPGAPSVAPAGASEVPPAPPPVDGAAPPAPAPAAASNDPAARAPGTWTPAAREKWSSLDPEVRAEIWKREREASRALTASTEARKFQGEFMNAVQPFMGFIAAEGSTPIQAVQNLMQTAAALRVGTPQQKVQVVADVIKNFGIDLQALDSYLAGQQPQFTPQTLIQQEVQRALTPLQQFQQQLLQSQRAQAQALDAETDSELARFASDPKNEFFPDVKDVMADLIEVAAKRGIQMGLTEAYERATLIHEPVRRVIEGRKQTEAARAAAARARNARNAASSITPSSEANVAQPVPGDSIRSAIEFAINAQQGR